MNSKTNKPAFLDVVYTDIANLLKEYQVNTANPEENEAFQEDLITLITDRMKGSFKNGIQVGIKKSEERN